MASRPEHSQDLIHQRQSELLTEPPLRPTLPLDTEAEGRSKAIDKALYEDAEGRRNHVNVLPLGAFFMGEVVKQLRTNNADDAGLTENELAEYRYNIHQSVFTCVRALLDSIDASGILLSRDDNSRYEYLRGFLSASHDDLPLNEEAAQAIKGLWQESFAIEAFQSKVDPSLNKSCAYFSQNITRIAGSDYIPTETDILHSHNGIRGVAEHRFHVNGLTINVIDTGLQQGERRKWIRHFDNVAAVLFVVDLPCYDNAELDRNEMEERMELFDSVVNTEWFSASTKFILFLNNISAFRERLSHTPFGDYFPDCEGGTEDEALEYLLRRFREVNRGGRKMYEYCIDPNRAENIELVAAAIKD